MHGNGPLGTSRLRRTIISRVERRGGGQMLRVDEGEFRCRITLVERHGRLAAGAAKKPPPHRHTPARPQRRNLVRRTTFVAPRVCQASRAGLKSTMTDLLQRTQRDGSDAEYLSRPALRQHSRCVSRAPGSALRGRGCLAASARSRSRGRRVWRPASAGARRETRGTDRSGRPDATARRASSAAPGPWHRATPSAAPARAERSETRCGSRRDRPDESTAPADPRHAAMLHHRAAPGRRETGPSPERGFHLGNRDLHLSEV